MTEAIRWALGLLLLGLVLQGLLDPRARSMRAPPDTVPFYLALRH